MGKRVRKPVVQADPEPRKPKARAAKAKTVTKVTKKVTKKVVTKKKVTKVKKAAPKRTPAPKKVKAPKKVAAPSGPKGYTSSEYQKFKSEKERLQSFSNADLKKMLRDNLQSMSGNKDDLVLKVADGIVLGRIPRCPNCFGGRPKYDYKTGIYTCPGYRDDEDYKNCHSTFTKEELKRDPWQ